MTEALRNVLARLGPLIVNDEAVAEREQLLARLDEDERRTKRASHLRAERVPLLEHARSAIVRGEPLPVHPKSLEAVQRWLRRPDVRPWLFLSGRPGCGKSVSAAWALANGPSFGLWFSAQALARAFSASFGPHADMQERALCADLLVIDDLGTEPHPERFAPSLVRILEARKNTDYRTLVTTNLSELELRRRYSDPRILSRFGQQAHVISDPGPDLRLVPVAPESGAR